jgi:hypothetical protein
MSIDSTDPQGNVTKDRTWRIQIETPEGVPATKYWVQWHREIAKTYNDGNTFPVEKTTTRRTAGDILTDEVTLSDGSTMTAAQLQEAIILFGDKYRQEDLDAAAAAE